jgi:hypothetical protein
MATQLISLGVQILPPQPPRNESGYDLHQFYRRTKVVSAESQISFADYQHGMHAFNLKGKRRREFIPAFAWNTQQLCRVIAVNAFRYVCGGRVLFPEKITLAELRRLTDEKFEQWKQRPLNDLSAVERRMIDRHIFSVDHAGGWLQLHATVAYMSWRLGYTSSQVAEQLWLTGPGVRMMLYRLTKVARALGYITFKSAAWMGANKIRQPHMVLLPPAAELLRIHESNPYWTAGRLSKRYKVQKSTVQKSILAAKKELRCGLHSLLAKGSRTRIGP